jgi:lipid-binding SYLF domain-containing protein
MSNLKPILSSIVVAAVLCFEPSAQAQQASSPPAAKAPATTLSRDSRAALNRLYAGSSTAKALGEKAVAILVFPDIKKAGFVVGGQYGEGTLFKGGKPAAYYSTGGVSYGLQAGAQKYGYAMFLMNDKAPAQLKDEGGDRGGAEVVIVDRAWRSRHHDDDEGRRLCLHLRAEGLMAGVGIQGTRSRGSPRADVGRQNRNEAP